MERVGLFTTKRSGCDCSPKLRAREVLNNILEKTELFYRGRFAMFPHHPFSRSGPTKSLRDVTGSKRTGYAAQALVINPLYGFAGVSGADFIR